MTEGVATFFREYIKADSLFTDKTVLQSTYMPADLQHRDEQINIIAKILAPGLRLERPSNLFIYGKTGSGKTVTVKHTLTSMESVAEENGIPLKTCYVNCKLKKIADTEYRIIAELARMFGKAVPSTGLPTDEIYNIFFRAVDEQRQIVVLVLDEIDQLVKKVGDEIIYNLTRINQDLKNAQLCIIGISNDLIFSNTLDPRVKSSLSEEEIVFPPYNATQLQKILEHRAQNAFENTALTDGVVAKCAAYAAREHGDARRALELLRVAGELAERASSQRITVQHIDIAEEKIDRDRILDVIKTQPKQFHATLHAMLLLCEKRDNVFTGDVFEVYKSVCQHTGQRTLTQRRISDIIAEMDMLGIINAKVISKGRFGRMREITLGLPEGLVPKVKQIVAAELGMTNTVFSNEAAAQERLEAFH
ncbi:MAG: orc1/cdc6 family replication initiation protein [Candidatus Woesearchaeota archaeon]|nr:orc1/cdc6 family replication initiation protein [Candidatus Woesearchaeota archaeon]